MDRIRSLLPIVGLTVASVLVVVLALKVRDLNEQYAETLWRTRELSAGMFVPTFQASTLTGEPVTVGTAEGEGRQVLFVFTTTCPYCQSTLPAWKEIVATLDTVTSVPVAVYGISLSATDVTERYVEENRLPYPVLRFPEEKLAHIYRARSVPLTVVLNAEGRVIHSRLGELKERAAIDSVVTMAQWQPEPAGPTGARTAAR